MKIGHISDLHIGKKLHGFSLLNYQEMTLNNIIDRLVENKISHLMISGDIFDKSVMASEAVKLYDKFISKLVENNISTYIISGNHDSYTKLALYRDLLKINKIYIFKAYDGEIDYVDVENTRIYGLPYLSFLDVKAYKEDVKSYNEAYDYVLSNLVLDKSKTNIIMMHGFFVKAGTDTITSESEKLLSVGGVDFIDLDKFKDFDYLALGHLHKSQNIANASYSGSILPYSFSEANNHFKINVFDTETKMLSEITYPLSYKLVSLSDKFDNLMRVVAEDNTFYNLEVLDEAVIYNLYDKLNNHFKNQVLLLNVKRFLESEEIEVVDTTKDPLTHFNDFCKKTINKDVSDNDYVKRVINRVLGGANRDH